METKSCRRGAPDTGNIPVIRRSFTYPTGATFFAAMLAVLTIFTSRAGFGTRTGGFHITAMRVACIGNRFRVFTTR